MGALQDLRYAFRYLLKHPLFTSIAVLILGLGIGLNAAIFTLLDAVMLNSLSVDHPEQIFLVEEGGHAPESSSFSYPEYARLRAMLPDSATLTAMTLPAQFYVSAANSQPEPALGQLVASQYFRAFGVSPSLGRLFSEEDDNIFESRPVAVISYGYWQRRFAGDPSILGSTMSVNGLPFTIVGVATRGYAGATPGRPASFWIPIGMQQTLKYKQQFLSKGGRSDASFLPQENIYWLRLALRVAPVGSAGQVQTLLNEVYLRDLALIERNSADASRREQFAAQHHLELVSGSRGFATLRRRLSHPLSVLMGVTGLVLLITCANISTLMLVRTSSRYKEMAVRLALGATRVRVVRQLFTESLLLGVLGGLCGVLTMRWCGPLLVWASTGFLPLFQFQWLPNFRVLLFMAGVSVFTGLLFGLAPAWQMLRVPPNVALKVKTEVFPGTRRGYFSRWSFPRMLVACQIALSLVALSEAAAFQRTLISFENIDSGFNRSHLLSVWFDPDSGGYSNAQLPDVYQRIVDRIEALPGVVSASLATCGVSNNCRDSSLIYVSGIESKNGEGMQAQENRVSAEYFKTLGIPVVAGRNFTSADNLNTSKVAIVNERFTEIFLGGKDPLIQYFGYQRGQPRDFQIVGIVKNARVNDVRDPAPPMIYYPLLQSQKPAHSLEVLTSEDPQWMVAQIKRAIGEVDRTLPVSYVSTQTEIVSQNLIQERGTARLVTLFGILGVTLACLGLYGATAYLVGRRTGEFGIRVALGASRKEIIKLVIRDILEITVAGILLGLCLSFAAVNLVSSAISGLLAPNALTIAGVVLILILIPLLAACWPATKASRVDPAKALNYE